MAGEVVSYLLKYTSVRDDLPLLICLAADSLHSTLYEDVLDGGMITLATYTLNFLHPGTLLGGGREWKRDHADATGSVDTVSAGGEQVENGEYKQ